MVTALLEDNLCQANFALTVKKNLQYSEANISKSFDLNDIKFGRVVKMPFSIPFEDLAVAPNLQNFIFDDVI